MRTVELAGTASAMGEAFGEELREETRALYALRVQNALAHAQGAGVRKADEAALLRLAEACLPPTEAFDPDGFEELMGIGRGAGLTPAEVLALGGLTDLRDALAWGAANDALGACTATVVQRDRARDGELLFAQTWDLATDNMPFVVVVHRRPDVGPETWALATAGSLTISGLNARGVAVGTTNLNTIDAGPGVPYTSALHRALASTTHAEAVAMIAGASRAGGHSFVVVDAEGRAAVVECTATRACVIPVDAGCHVHCNHCLVSEHAALEADTPQRSSRFRHRRMTELLAKRSEGHDVDSLIACLADHENGDLAICRDDYAGISTNAAVVIAPEQPAMRVCHGPPCGLKGAADWVDVLS